MHGRYASFYVNKGILLSLCVHKMKHISYASQIKTNKTKGMGWWGSARCNTDWRRNVCRKCVCVSICNRLAGVYPFLADKWWQLKVFIHELKLSFSFNRGELYPYMYVYTGTGQLNALVYSRSTHLSIEFTRNENEGKLNGLLTFILWRQRYTFHYYYDSL